ncbi:metal ABC transporter solute-binding protein, Zn/Mn family [Insolitispirillum peregrinum]|uniref:metal ABC transporter solute-binding protein, Zn/Mn family n=1 Tax=Insolitispirillum peregrinum TaxID=80876 RepID=UPI003611D454
MLKKLSVAAVAAAVMLGSLPAFAEPLKVVASFSILGDMVREIGGDAVSVTTLVGPDGDAHVYQPTPSDAQAVAGAGMVILNGLGFEPWSERLLSASGTRAAVVTASQGVTPREMADEDEDHDEHGKHDDHAKHEDHHHHGNTDPHAWQDLKNGQMYVATIAKALEAARPAEASAIAARAESYRARLETLDGWVRSELASIPAAQRKLITSHDAFGYFGAAYGVEFLAPMGLSTEAEPTPKDVARLVKQMKAEKVRAVFLENMSDPRLVKQLAKDAKGVVGGTLYADALSAADGPAATYEAMFRSNVKALKDTLLAAQ